MADAMAARRTVKNPPVLLAVSGAEDGVIEGTDEGRRDGARLGDLDGIPLGDFEGTVEGADEGTANVPLLTEQELEFYEKQTNKQTN